MTETERLLAGLRFAREFSRGLLDEIDSDEQWLARPHDRANHALWFAGHMALVDNSTILLIAPRQAVRLDDYKPLFGMGSTPHDDLSKYPPVEEVRARMDERRDVLLEAAKSLTDEDLNRSTPESSPPFIPTVGAALQFMIWHEGLHAGQITVVHRSLGREPFAGRPAKETTNA